MRLRTRRITWFCITAPIAVLLLATSVNTAWTAYTLTESADTTVEATVLNSELDTYDTRRGDRHDLNITYRYEYNNQTYTSDNVYSGDVAMSFRDKDKAEREIADFRENTTVTAHVAPGNPPKSYLLQPSDGTVLEQSVFALVLAVPFLYTSLRHLLLIVRGFRVPGPSEVTLDRAVVREQLVDVFEEIEEFPVTKTRDAIGHVRSKNARDHIKNTWAESVDFQQFEIDAKLLNRLVTSDPASPCQSPEELAEFFVSEMERQGYFSSGPTTE